MIIDENEQILLANKAFSNKIGYDGLSLLGIRLSELNWKHISADKSGKELPWQQVIKSGKNVIGSQLIFAKSKNDNLKFAINASPILSENDILQGVLVTLDDVSELEKRNSDLKTMIARLQKTQFQVRQKNKELSFLEHLVELEHLLLDGTRTTGAGLEHLKNLPELRSLSVRATPFDDAALEQLLHDAASANRATARSASVTRLPSALRSERTRRPPW